MMMSLIEEFSKELERNPELAKRLARKLIEYIEPELSVSVQMGKLAEQMGKLAEEQTKIWIEIKAIKEEQTKIWQEIRALKEEQTKIWIEIKAIKEEQTKIWQEIRALKEEQVKLKEEQTKLREDFNKMLAEIREIKIRQDRFEKELTRISESITYGFSQLSKFAGVTFEQFIRILLTDLFRKFGEIPEDSELRSTIIDGEEVDIFLENPLVVGEVTAHAELEEMDKLLRKARKAEEIYGRKARLILVAETAGAKIAKELRRRAEKEGIELIIGKEV